MEEEKEVEAIIVLDDKVQKTKAKVKILKENIIMKK